MPPCLFSCSTCVWEKPVTAVKGNYLLWQWWLSALKTKLNKHITSLYSVFRNCSVADRGKEQAKAEHVLPSAWLEINDSNHIDSNLAFSALPTCCCCCHALHSAAILCDSSSSRLALLAVIRGGRALQLHQGCGQRGAQGGLEQSWQQTGWALMPAAGMGLVLEQSQGMKGEF